MYTDLWETLGRIAEEQRIAQEEAKRSAAARDERLLLARMKRERRARPTKDSTVSKYADMIEEKVRKAEVRQNKRGRDETEA